MDYKKDLPQERDLHLEDNDNENANDMIKIMITKMSAIFGPSGAPLVPFGRLGVPVEPLWAPLVVSWGLLEWSWGEVKK